MALRVLLADESTTIKKVIQLALQDYAVEVKAVTSGLDVLEVARSFKPDLVFADVLLQKRSGYDACADLKLDPEVGRTPVILMWSAFMELDEPAFMRSKADARLEKPFDLETLRNLVKDLVPKTRTNPMTGFLNFPSNITDSLRQESQTKTHVLAQPGQPIMAQPGQPIAAQPPQRPAAQTSIPQPPPLNVNPPSSYQPPPTAVQPPPIASQPVTLQPTPVWNMESFDKIDQFSDKTHSGDLNEKESFAELKLSRTVKTVAPQPPPIQSSTVSHDPLDLTGAGSVYLADPRNEEKEEVWSQKNLSRFRLDLPTEDTTPMATANASASQTPEAEAPIAVFEMPAKDQQTAHLKLENPFNPAEPLPAFEPNSEYEVPQLSADRLEDIVRAQSREVIEALVKRLVPDLAAEIIRQELERLLQDADRS
jgi:CheY-like chemotaxis protein